MYKKHGKRVTVLLLAGGMFLFAASGNVTAWAATVNSDVLDAEELNLLLEESAPTAEEESDICDANEESTGDVIQPLATGDTAAFAVYSETDNSLIFYYGVVPDAGNTYNERAVTSVYEGIESTNVRSASNIEWYKIRTSITEVSFDESFSQVTPASTAFWFYGFTNCTAISLTNFNTSKVTNMSQMFYNCSSVTSLDVSGFNLSSVKKSGNDSSTNYELYQMFHGCSALTSLDLSSWDTSAITNMGELFYGCSSLTDLTLGDSFDTGSVTNMSGMFYECKSLTALDIGNWSTSNATNMANLFYHCEGLTELDLSAWVVSNVTNMSDLFYGCTNLKTVDLSGWNTGKVTNMADMFGHCESLIELDLSGWDVSSVTGGHLTDMFYYCTSLETLNLSGWNIADATLLVNMFAECTNLKYLDLSDWELGNVTDMGDMFADCASLVSLDVSGWDTSSVTSMQSMFSGCANLEFLDVTGWDTSNVTDMFMMFKDCSSLKTIDVSGFDTSNVTEMYQMFENCSSLTELDLSTWDTGRCTDYADFAIGCTSLDWIKIGDDFDLFEKSVEALVSQTNWYSNDTFGIELSDNSMIGIGKAGQYWTHTEGDIQLTIVDQNGSNLTGAEFTIQDSEGHILYFLKDGDAYILCEEGANGATSTITAGDIAISILTGGTYTITEVTVPQGYTGPTGSVEISVDENGMTLISGDGQRIRITGYGLLIQYEKAANDPGSTGGTESTGGPSSDGSSGGSGGTSHSSHVEKTSQVHSVTEKSQTSDIDTCAWLLFFLAILSAVGMMLSAKRIRQNETWHP